MLSKRDIYFAVMLYSLIKSLSIYQKKQIRFIVKAFAKLTAKDKHRKVSKMFFNKRALKNVI